MVKRAGGAIALGGGCVYDLGGVGGVLIVARDGVRILFVNPVPPEAKKVYTGFNHGIGWLSAAAKLQGHETRLETISRRDDGFLRRVGEWGADVVAVTGTSAQWALAAWAAGRLAGEFPAVFVVAGGAHSTVATEEVISADGVRAACRGEGDETFVKLLEGLRGGGWEDTAGFWTKPEGPAGVEVVRNEAARLVDVTGLGWPDREVYDYQGILDRNRQNVGAEFMASRGCPYECSYCINAALGELTGGEWKRVRYREPGDVVDEVESVVSRYDGIKMVGFHDDIFGLDKGWLRAFAGEYGRRVGLPFWCNERVGTFDEDDVAILKEAGCFRVHMGLESADEALRREVLNRDISNEEIVEAFRLVRRHGMRTVAFNMIGVPHETEETLRATIELNRRVRPDWMIVSVFAPFPGTRLGDVAREEGWVTGELPASFYDRDYALEQPSISRERLLYYYDNFVGMACGKG